MLDLILLTSTVTSSGVIEDTPSVTPSYTNIEIYFWYATLFIMVVLTIIFVKSDVSGKKKIVNISNSISKRVAAIDKYVLDGKANKAKYRKLILATIHVLDSADVALIELKEKTRLDDISKIMTYKGEIVAELKTIISLPVDKATDELNSVKSKLISLKGQIDIVVALVR